MMDGLFSSMLDERGSALVTAILVVSVALLALVVVFWIYRLRGGRMAPGRGGRRESRLAVIDSAMIDQRRRLVLIRRDDVEHLVLIGGPADLVVESGIGAAAMPRPSPRPAATVEAASPVQKLEEPVRPAAQAAVAEEAVRPNQTGKAAAPAAAAAGQFPPERFKEPAAPSAPGPEDGAVKAGNPFDEAAFSAVLEAEIARHGPKTKIPAFAGLDQRAAERARAAIAPAEPPAASRPAPQPPQKAASLEEEMARLLGDIKPERR